MPSTKVVVAALTGLVLQAAIAVTGNPSVISWLPVRWQAIASIVAGAIVAYTVAETRPAPSAVAHIQGK